jgi:MoxR-like ATPase
MLESRWGHVSRPSTTTETSPSPAGVSGVTLLERRLVRVHPAPGEGRCAWRLGGEPVALGRDVGADDISIDDSRASRRHAEISPVRGHDRLRVRDLGSTNGTFVNGRRVEDEYLHDGAVLRLGSSLLVYSECEWPAGLSVVDPPSGVSLARARAELLIDLAAGTSLPILIQGPTGAGKERLAQRAHEKSRRRGAFVAANCAAFDRELIGSELFGHVRGAFSGAATARAGLFVASAGGTLFLDEVGELPLDHQPVLLRALQEQRVRPVGSDREVAVDVRVVAATNRDLRQMEARGAFRGDLLARIGAVVVELPGLAARRDEILALFEVFSDGRPLTTDAAEALLLHDWAHNIRELHHVAAQVNLFSPGRGPLELAMLPASVRHRAWSTKVDAEADRRPSRVDLEDALRRSAGSVAGAARLLGCQRTQVYRWLATYGIDRARFRGD